MVTILHYKKITIYHAIYIKVLSGVTVSYITFSVDDVLNTTNNDTAFPELIFSRTLLDEIPGRICR